MADDGRRGEEEERGPGAAHQVFVVMECLLEKLKVLNYEEEVLAKHNMKNLSRWDENNVSYSSWSETSSDHCDHY